jgi:gliding motility-associated lipoprotein GldH
MRWIAPFLLAACLLLSCDNHHVYHAYQDLEKREWRVADKREFVFDISDHQKNYNLYFEVRNATDYPYSRLFVNYTLMDSTGKNLDQKLLQEYLFDAKTGQPFGRSGLGDLYDHQFLLKQNYKFPYRGSYKIKFEQFMRVDTLQGIVAVGLSIEDNAQQ